MLITSRDNQSSDSSDTRLHRATGTATGKTKSAQHADFVATHTTTVKRKEKENFTAAGVRDTHTAMLHVQGNVTQAPPGSNTKGITHPSQTMTQYHQQSPSYNNYNNYKLKIITSTPPVLAALQTSPSSS